MGMKTRANSAKASLPTIWPEYTNKDLDAFAKFLEGFREEVKARNMRTGEMETITIINLEEAMVEYGAVKKRVYEGKAHYSVIIPPEQVDSLLLTQRKPNKFELFNHIRSALQDRNAKREYAKKKEVEEYSQMAESEIKVDELVKNGEVAKGFPE